MDRPEGLPGVDQGVMPVSWSAWLAELDRQLSLNEAVLRTKVMRMEQH